MRLNYAQRPESDRTRRQELEPGKDLKSIYIRHESQGQLFLVERLGELYKSLKKGGTTPPER